MFLNDINQAVAISMNLGIQDIMTLDALVKLSKFAQISDDGLFVIKPLEIRTFHPLMNVTNGTLAKRLEILSDSKVIELHKKGNRMVNFKFISQTLKELYSTKVNVVIEKVDAKATTTSSTPKKIQEALSKITELANQKLIPQFKSFTPKRIRSLSKLVDEFGQDEVVKAFVLASESDFLLGKLGENWYTIEWLLGFEKFSKLLEGEYNKNQRSTVAEEFTERKSKIVMM